MSQTTKAPMKRVKKDTRVLPVKLTDLELIERASTLAKARIDQVVADEAKKAAAKQWKQKIDDAAAEVTRLSRIVKAREEDRDVDVEQTYDFEKKMLFVHRLDTGAEVDSRPLTSDELQVQFEWQSREEKKAAAKLSKIDGGKDSQAEGA